MKQARRALPEVGLIVEGQTEFVALPKLARLLDGCPLLRAINLRGVGAERPPIGIARLAAPHVIAHQAAGRSRIVFCLDREERKECPGQLAQAVTSALTTELRSRGRDPKGLAVVVADRSFEAWILADARGLFKGGHFKAAPKFTSFEGHLGKRNNKGLDELADLLGRPYVKTVDGPKLFEALSFATARTFGPGRHGSRSLDKLLRTLGV
ncbi:DUF4276 family protein [Polyangium aurulentum]|uniref:DUF4276 family protein n=1 Tax=Polyangium aurulentum TaxID=2567896 RepID=UPI00146DBAE2|nr:DUF4276 family protein [Polyangium aurulentum]UQA63465.1 DUF4276 family protein [Polyangium aurulentum]